MAGFRGTVQGHRGEASRLGHATSGLTGFMNGWHVGADICLMAKTKETDELTVRLSRGSNGGYLPFTVTALYVLASNGDDVLCIKNSPHTDRDCANARLICTAVNHHTRLVEALKNLRKQIKQEWMEEYHQSPLNKAVLAVDEALAALKREEGGK